MSKIREISNTGKFHTADYLKAIGVPDIPPSTSPFDPGYDPVTFRGSLGAEFPPHVDSEDRTGEIVERWRDSPPEACLNGNSANYLRRSGQLKDLDFILSHINDLDGAFALGNNEIIEVFDEAMATARAKGSLSNLVEAR